MPQNECQSGIGRILAPALCIACLLTQGVASAQTSPQFLNSLVRSNYTVLSGDVNGDGQVDILMRAQRRIVIIHYDVPFPVPIPTPSPTFVLLSGSGGSYSLVTPVSAAMLNSSAWQTNRYDLRFGDLLGNGAGGVIIEARNAGDPSFSVAANTSGQPSLVQTLTPAAVGFDLGANGIMTELADRNSDGRADLTILQDGFVASVLIANASGVFAQDAESTIRAVWLGFKAYLDSNDASSALGYVSLDSIPVYTDVLTSLGPHLREVSATWSDINAIEIGANYATFSIVSSANSQQTLHILVFVKENNRWVLESM